MITVVGVALSLIQTAQSQGISLSDLLLRASPIAKLVLLLLLGIASATILAVSEANYAYMNAFESMRNWRAATGTSDPVWEAENRPMRIWRQRIFETFSCNLAATTGSSPVRLRRVRSDRLRMRVSSDSASTLNVRHVCSK